MSAVITVFWVLFVAALTLAVVRLNRRAAPACVIEPALKARARPDEDGNGCG